MFDRQISLPCCVCLRWIHSDLHVWLTFPQTIEDLIAVGKEHNPRIDQFDASCFDSKYVTPGITEEFLFNLEKAGRGKRQFQAEQPAPIGVASQPIRVASS